MFKKSFISLYFLKDRILLLILDAKRKKVKKFASLDLPGGLIKNYKITDTNLLAKLLKNAWIKLRLKERSLGMVIPEFSTFTKLLSLPKLKPGELDEAVRWQVQDFLPDDLEEIILDWQIVGENDEGYEVLVVAVDKDVLKSYVKSAEAAGLFPMAVETPSLCLARVFSDGANGGNLIIYKFQGEVLLIVSRKLKIFGTSVVSADLDKVISMALRMINHYKDENIEKVLIGGELDENTVSLIGEKLEKKAEMLKLEFSGISESQMQKYLIPVCMQLNNLDEPSDPYSLNLLPLNLVEKYRKAKLNLQTWGLTLMTTLFAWMSLLAILGSYLFINQRVDDQKKENLARQSVNKQAQEAVEKVKFTNEISENILKIKKISVLPQTVLNEISRSQPPGVIIEDYKMDFDLASVSLQGTSATRNDLVEFKKNLEENSNIGTIDVPISSFEEESNIDFGLTFKYLPLISSGSTKK